ncbi:MAG: DNA polymerase III subunit gamma/tau, partial [Actinomycetota bacterium]
MIGHHFPAKLMGHLSLYRKYRPQTFGEVVGQDHVTRTLRNALAESRVAHAYLFSGPRGTGKTTTARILAKALNCQGRSGPDPDNTCASCLEISQGSSLDVVEIDAASHGSVDDARDLRDKVAYAPVAGRWRVYIIDECHMLSAPANNALLKVLEEPPAHVVFVFATTEPHKVLQTLLDRCQRYEFRALEAAAIAGRLAEIAGAEDLDVAEDAIALMTSRAAGSMRDAVSLLDQLASFAGARIGADDVSRLFGGLPDDVLFEAVELVAERDAGGCFVFSDRLIRSGRDIREFVRALVEHLRSLFVLTHAPTARDLLDVPDERLEQLRAQANRFGPAELLRILDLANELHLVLRQPVDGRLALEATLARMARPDLHAAPASLLSRIERLERLAGIEDAAEAGAITTQPAVRREAPPSKPARRRSERPAARRP